MLINEDNCDILKKDYENNFDKKEKFKHKYKIGIRM